jgi:Arc/MetJ family transcription regulator
MRTTLNLTDDMMHELLRVTHADTKTQAVTRAIRDYVRRRQLEELRALRGKLRLRDEWRRLEQAELRELKHRGPRRG